MDEGRKYTLRGYVMELYPMDFVVWHGDSGNCFLNVNIHGYDLHGLDMYERIGHELVVMHHLVLSLSTFLDERIGRDAIVIPDRTDKDLRGVELKYQFGYMTGGMLVNLSEMHAVFKPVQLVATDDGYVTLCSSIEYENKYHDKESRLVRIGSGLGVDEAVCNARGRLSSLIEDIDSIDEFVFNEMVLKNQEHLPHLWQ